MQSMEHLPAGSSRLTKTHSNTHDTIQNNSTTCACMQKCEHSECARAHWHGHKSVRPRAYPRTGIMHLPKHAEANGPMPHSLKNSSPRKSTIFRRLKPFS